MKNKQRSIEWLLELTPAQFNSAAYAKGNSKWRESLTEQQKTDLALKLSLANKGKVRTQETRDKISKSKLGKPLPRTPEWQAKITAALTGKIGHKQSENAKRKISLANTGRLKGVKRGPQTAVHKQNHKNSLFAAGLTTRCHTPLGIFNSRADAARAHNVDPVTISNWMIKEKSGFYYLDQKDISKCEIERKRLKESLVAELAKKSLVYRGCI